MALYPDVQLRAQEELDAVVGQNRLPDFSDRPHLPYVNAVIKEVLRWHVVLPLGVPHQTTTDEVYNGYYIPAGTVVCPNVWYVFDVCYMSELTHPPLGLCPETPTNIMILSFSSLKGS